MVLRTDRGRLNWRLYVGKVTSVVLGMRGQGVLISRAFSPRVCWLGGT